MNLKRFLKNKEVGNAGWLIGGKVFQMAISLVVGVITARYLGPSNYGLIGYGTAYVTFFSAFCTLGLNSVIIKDFVDHKDEQGEAIGSAIVMRLVSSVLSSLMIIGFVSIIDRNEPTTIAVVALCSVGTIFHVFETFNFWFQSQYKSKVTSIATLTAYIITSVYKIILLMIGKDVRWFAFSTSVDYIVVAVFLYVAYRKFHGAKLRFSIKKSKSLLKISYNYILSTMMVAIYGQTDKLLLKQLCDDSSVGYFTTATTVCAMWVFVLQAIIDSVYPTILNLKGKDQLQYERKNRQLYAIVFYVSCMVSVGFLVLGDFVIKILYGEAYMPAADILKVVSWYTAFSYLGVARNAWIVSEGKQKYLKYIYGAAAILNVVMNLILIPVMGTIGAATATLITQILTSIVLPIMFKELRPNTKLMLEAICLRKLR